MSLPSPSSNSYTNGNNGRKTTGDTDGVNADYIPKETGREGRSGGYGGLNGIVSALGDVDLRHDMARQGSDIDTSDMYGRLRADRRDFNTSSNSRNIERTTPDLKSSRGFGTGPGARQIEGVLEHIHEKWDMMTKDDCLAVHVALQLMDHSSLGRGNDYQDFQRTSHELQKALKAIVNEHHQGFNSSIGTFHKIQSSIQTSQSRVRSLKESMHNAKANLMISKPGLKGLGASSQKYDAMLQLLAQIEKLQQVPDQLDACISEKHFLSAVEILQEALRMIRKSDMDDIGALNDLRSYFSNQETSLTDILIEELHDHLYLKSPYCHDRWKPNVSEVTGTSTSGNAASLPLAPGRPLYIFLNNLDTSVPLEEDASRNPEIDSFHYMYMVIESLNKLGRLDVAVNRLEQRLPIELFNIVGKTNQEVDQRHPGHFRDIFETGNGIPDLDYDGYSSRSHVLKEFLLTLYSKFTAIAEGHRAVHDVVAGIVAREGLRHPEPLMGGFKEMWKLFQSEVGSIRSLLHDYLSTDGNFSSRPNRNSAMESNIFQRTTREKPKRVFKFAGIDKKSPELASEQEELDHILRASVPGLVSKSTRGSDIGHNEGNFASEVAVAGHKVLTEPSVFNISLLLPPSLSFLQALKEIVPLNSDIKISTLTSFLDDFLVNVFQPQLEETVTELCTRSLVAQDSFQQDPQWSRHAAIPIFRGTTTFFTLVRAFCKLLDSLPYDQAFSQLIISQIVGYYDKCYGWYRALVTRTKSSSEGGLRLKTAATMAENGEIRETVEKLWTSGSADQAELASKETELLISKTNETPLEPFDIISDPRSVEALCLLYSSMQWLASRLSQIRRVVDNIRNSQRDSSIPLRRRWTLLGTAAPQGPASSVYLPLNSDTALAFDKTLASIRMLATTALLTLQLDIRAGVIHMLTRTLSSPYLLPHPATDPDPSVLTLNTDLLNLDNTLTTHLPNAEHTFIMTGLTKLVDTFLVRNAGKVSAMNMNGCGRMQLNILVLQQNLKAVETRGEVALSRSAAFYDLFLEGAEGVVARAKLAGQHGGVSSKRTEDVSSPEKGSEGDRQDVGGSAGKNNGGDADENNKRGEAGNATTSNNTSSGLGFFSLEEMKVLLALCYSEGLRSDKREVVVQAKRGLNEHMLALSEFLWDA